MTPQRELARFLAGTLVPGTLTDTDTEHGCHVNAHKTLNRFSELVEHVKLSTNYPPHTRERDANDKTSQR